MRTRPFFSLPPPFLVTVRGKIARNVLREEAIDSRGLELSGARGAGSKYVARVVAGELTYVSSFFRDFKFEAPDFSSRNKATPGKRGSNMKIIFSRVIM